MNCLNCCRYFNCRLADTSTASKFVDAVNFRYVFIINRQTGKIECKKYQPDGEE